jgi:hypothetical protein
MATELASDVNFLINVDVCCGEEGPELGITNCPVTVTSEAGSPITYDFDAEGGTPPYSWMMVSGVGGYIDTGTGSWVWDPGWWCGVFDFVIVVTDNEGQSDTCRFNAWAHGPDTDVTIRLNGGADVAYIGEFNTVEIWIQNPETPLRGMSLGLEFIIASAYAWDMSYGSHPPVNEESAATGVWDLGGLQVAHDFDDTSPDHVLFGGAALMGGFPAHSTHVLCYTLRLEIPAGESPQTNGFSVVPYFYPPAGSWSFAGPYGNFPPDFQCNVVPTATGPFADTADFDIVHRYATPAPPVVPGDADGNGVVNVSDAVYLICYIFSDGPPPVPYAVCSGDVDCSCIVNVTDAVYEISYIFGGGEMPCVDEEWLGNCGEPLR